MMETVMTVLILVFAMIGVIVTFLFTKWLLEERHDERQRIREADAQTDREMRAAQQKLIDQFEAKRAAYEASQEAAKQEAAIGEIRRVFMDELNNACNALDKAGDERVEEIVSRVVRLLEGGFGTTQSSVAAEGIDDLRERINKLEQIVKFG